MTSATIGTIDSIKARLKSTWTAGDYDRFSRFMEGGAREFYERLNVSPGSQLLDVACGSGQLALMAAKDGAAVTGVDIAGNLVERAQARVQAEGLNARFEEADAESLPFADASFDVVVSLIGAMFAPRPHLVAQELLRVCVPGGTIAMANWTPQGFVGQMFKAVSKFIAPSGMPSPVLWGDEPTVRERLSHGLSELSLARRQYLFSYPFLPSEVVDFFSAVLRAGQPGIRRARQRRAGTIAAQVGSALDGAQPSRSRLHDRVGGIFGSHRCSGVTEGTQRKHESREFQLSTVFSRR